MRYKAPPMKLARPTVPVAVDAVIVHRGKIVLTKRAIPPFKGYFTVPGGFVIPGYTTRETCIKEAKEETGLDVEIIRLIGVFDDPHRDPRGHTLSVVYLCKSVGGKLEPQKTETSEVRLFSPEEIKKMELGFDHKKEIEGAGLI
jgi:8-oxo-dGTP diphosphatase